MDADLHRACANTIRGLAMDAVQAADSGHPGMPMGMADVATVLWTRFLKFDPNAPEWPDRDRFVLSAGHGSMLLYALLHLSGFDLSLDDLRAFRQWGSRTPGHPEHGHTPGVETTTGPLGQGFANAVGMALTERYLRETFGAELCDHWTWGICSDGDLMEGVSAEAASLAGHLRLGRLVFLYDDNHISIDGDTALAFDEDVPARFAAYGWHVERVDGHDPEAIARAIERARAETERPSLVACRTIIGKGSPTFQGTERTHGAALGVEEVRKTKQALGMDPDATFVVPDRVAAAFRGAASAEAHQAWHARVEAHAEGAKLRAWLQPDWDAVVADTAWPSFEVGKSLATRKANAACLKAVVAAAPHLVGGSADLLESNGLTIGRASLTPQGFAGTGQIHFGVREHAMAAICNGIALHRGLRPFGGTFLVFHDYHRPSVRLAAMMKLPVIFVYSHDSIWLGEDGPTHQPIDTLVAVRILPGIEVWRPGDATETAEAWKAMLARTDGPSAIVTTRQGLPTLDPAKTRDTARGAYVLAEPEGGAAQVVLIGTGSEVTLCLAAQQQLAGQGIRARVVSMPCRERFDAQDDAYRAQVLLSGVPRVSVEAATTFGWERWVGADGAMVGIDTWGASAPGKVVAEKFGFTADHVAGVAAGLVK
ncbi:MAG: transketolase [Myxococcota bacterium]